MDFIDTARRVCGAGSVKQLSVRPFVCLSHRSTAAAACGGFVAERPACRRYRSTAVPALSSKRGQCHVDSRGTMLNTGLLHTQSQCRLLCVHGVRSHNVRSAAVRHDLRQRDDHLPADVLDVGALPRYAQQHQGLHEDTRRAQVARRTSHRLRRLDLVAHQRHRNHQGLQHV